MPIAAPVTAATTSGSMPSSVPHSRWVSGGSFQPCSGTDGSTGGSAPRAKYTSSFGNVANAASGRPKFFASSAGGVCPTQSVMLKVPNSEK